MNVRCVISCAPSRTFEENSQETDQRMNRIGVFLIFTCQYIQSFKIAVLCLKKTLRTYPYQCCGPGFRLDPDQDPGGSNVKPTFFKDRLLSFSY
jgi:hypothetical protein